MQKILVPIAGSPTDEAVVRHVVRQALQGQPLEIHLLNVQTPFRWHVARFIPRREREGFYREQAGQALRPSRQRLDRAGLAYTVHTAVGDSALCITELAHSLRCDRILMGTARKDSLVRLVEDCVVNRVLELTTVPVEVIAGTGVSKWERYGIPAAVGALLAMALAD
ncbi:MAG TPA: universal stress protein [Ramlibacter sp.]|uniref:universal stress protein n=1 Tax=Ramlibacter sp. TaxID=1917967 RepID=UPI002D7E2E29|nr:universal stress protein [Ramlibacter sp.]HET8746886.1 universal stress protein [Ramlibacter sp.]